MSSENCITKRCRRRLNARTYKNYTEEMLQLAVNLVRTNKSTSYAAEKRFGIPRRTIDKRVKNIHSSKPGRRFRLSREEESQFIKAIIASEDFGCPLYMIDFKLMVWDYLAKNNKTDVFNNKLPGDWWVRNFLNRYIDQLTINSSQKITKICAGTTIEEYKEYFNNLEISLQNLPPSNIINYEEINLSDVPGSLETILYRGVTNLEDTINHSRGCISLMLAATADGELLPPYVVYKSKKLMSKWCKDGPEDARFNKSENGCFDSVVFLDWFQNIIIPWAGNIDGRKLVIGNNLSSHLNLEIVELCEIYQIGLAFLPLRSTHLTQPLSVALLSTLKESWKTILYQYKIENPHQESLNKCHCPLLLKQLIKAAKKKDNIIEGFKATGIYPFNPFKVYKKLLEYEENIKYDVDEKPFVSIKVSKKHSPLCRKQNTAINVPPEKAASKADKVLRNKCNLKKITNSTKTKENVTKKMEATKSRKNRQRNSKLSCSITYCGIISECSSIEDDSPIIEEWLEVEDFMDEI